MSKYNKFIVALVGAVVAGVTAFTGFDLEGAGLTTEAIVAIIVPLLTALGVWAVPNTP